MGFFNSKPKKQLPWVALTTEEQLKNALVEAEAETSLFFKHSTRCSISSMAMARFEENWNLDNACKLFYLDLITFRNVSNLMAELTHVEHQSPQVIVIRNNELIYTATHSAIDARQIEQLL
jgi:bacillithiol system protein YtxJ